jgi:hypothetical protein
MSAVTYHMRRARAGNVVTVHIMNVSRSLPDREGNVGTNAHFDWGYANQGTLNLAEAILKHAIRFPELAGLAARPFALDVLTHLDGDCVLDRAAVRDWFFRSVRFEPSSETLNGEDHTNGSPII